jgi:predicted regulator of Ras-like GTPase activity (Roadblock/LC7/MglB family)
MTPSTLVRSSSSERVSLIVAILNLAKEALDELTTDDLQKLHVRFKDDHLTLTILIRQEAFE